jgi:hypothetical protein
MRERRRGEGPGERSSPHPGEPLAGAPAGAGPEQAVATLEPRLQLRREHAVEQVLPPLAPHR